MPRGLGRPSRFPVRRAAAACVLGGARERGRARWLSGGWRNSGGSRGPGGASAARHLPPRRRLDRRRRPVRGHGAASGLAAADPKRRLAQPFSESARRAGSDHGRGIEAWADPQPLPWHWRAGRARGLDDSLADIARDQPPASIGDCHRTVTTLQVPSRLPSRLPSRPALATSTRTACPVGWKGARAQAAAQPARDMTRRQPAHRDE
jgi:hypothetical protein